VHYFPGGDTLADDISMNGDLGYTDLIPECGLAYFTVQKIILQLHTSYLPVWYRAVNHVGSRKYNHFGGRCPYA